ncbi:3-isopropylmalate dehydratase large subunit [Bradyrhizobium sp. LHD-71]|uniref:3-isopropylmalate dehydratase large subunit n=1 Tax=Bradyrhizobium sp. LHD-71 TaxID=3072141 RepID=UPI00280EA533|nr:3-isopropylmalate dehydratase large subunit [Bradyrhizobium sp. LHD-71]MDQ8729138.1 3-isopropylmalate dehydratase large subunit [Bradyrhizobium sp. LHD-71]
MMAKPQTFFEKMWNDHVIADLGDGASLLQIDRLFLHDLSGSAAIARLEESGRPINSRDQVFGVVDHLISSRPGRGPDDTASRGGVELIQSMRQLSHKYGITFFDSTDARQGIVHVVSPELGIALPGTTLVCGDSHTCTVGGVGALAWGIGSTECEHVLATQTLAQVRPKTMRINFEGEVGPGVYPKDLILYLIGEIGANGGIGYAAEFAGSAIRKMSVEGRMTICNMAIEFQAKYGFVPADDVTFDYIKGRDFAPKGHAWDEAVAYWRSLATDEHAVFDQEVTIDCARIQPQVTWGTSPQQVAGIGDRVPDPADMSDPGVRTLLERAIEYIQLRPGTPLDGVKIDAAYIGSCTNARISDLRDAAAVLKGRKVAPGVRAICVPGSSTVKRAAEAEGLDRTFRDAGFEWHESGCAMCASQGGDYFANLRVISTTNRNFEGRQGPQTRTHLASPVTVAASAIAGRIADARTVIA